MNVPQIDAVVDIFFTDVAEQMRVPIELTPAIEVELEADTDGWFMRDGDTLVIKGATIRLSIPSFFWDFFEDKKKDSDTD